MKTPIYNFEGTTTSEIELSEKVFNAPWNGDLVHQAMNVQMANRRQPVAHTKDRSEVRGGGAKPWRQKGTGRARHGSNRSPIWAGGGVTHGPRNDKSYSRSLNKKMLRAAIHSVLSRKLRENELHIMESLSLESPKTKVAAKAFSSTPSLLLMSTGEHKNLHRATRNIPRIKAIDIQSINVVDLLQYKNVYIAKDALDKIQ
jgi:large subunit ribosomal protein L4